MKLGAFSIEKLGLAINMGSRLLNIQYFLELKIIFQDKNNKV